MFRNYQRPKCAYTPRIGDKIADAGDYSTTYSDLAGKGRIEQTSEGFSAGYTGHVPAFHKPKPAKPGFGFGGGGPQDGPFVAFSSLDAPIKVPPPPQIRADRKHEPRGGSCRPTPGGYPSAPPIRTPRSARAHRVVPHGGHPPEISGHYRPPTGDQISENPVASPEGGDRPRDAMKSTYAKDFLTKISRAFVSASGATPRTSEPTDGGYESNFTGARPAWAEGGGLNKRTVDICAQGTFQSVR